MSVYQCEKCGCAENSALGFYHGNSNKSFKWPEEFFGKKLCSACGPTHFSDKTRTRWGQWHGRFDRVFLPSGMFETQIDGCLVHKVSKDPDYRKYRIEPEI